MKQQPKFRYGPQIRKFASINCCFRTLKGKASIFKARKQALFSRLQSLTDLFRTGKKKHELVEENDACLLLKSYDIVIWKRTFYFVHSKDA